MTTPTALIFCFPPLYIVWTILFHSQFLYVHTRVYAFQQYTLIRMWSKGPFFSYLPCRPIFFFFFFVGRERENIFNGSSTPHQGLHPHRGPSTDANTHFNHRFPEFFTRRKPLFVPSSIVSFIYARHSCGTSKFHNLIFFFNWNN